MSVEDALFAKVMSKKFRKVRVDEESVAITKKAISLAVKDNKPVIISILFGGNKLWRFEEAPEIDWAELFSITYFLQWMKSIASVYEPGVCLDYYSEDVAVEKLNNIPKSETDQYSETFKLMLEWLKPYVPKNVTIQYRRYGDEYNDISEYYAELEEAKQAVLKENGGKLPVLTDVQKLATELNVRLLPGQDKDPEWREKVELIHKSLERTKTMLRYFEDPTLIPACPTWYPATIATGSTKRSYAKFWAAVGVLERDGDTFHELVLTPKQLKAANFEWEEVNLPSLKGKNFQRVRILK